MSAVSDTSFMREALAKALPSLLRPADEFLFLPVYYAGGTASFSPTSDEVAETCRATLGDRADAVKSFGDRLDCGEYLKKTARRGDIVIIAGARDESLSIWAKSMVKYA